jgi:sugar lactone lactonase YvrE
LWTLFWNTAVMTAVPFAVGVAYLFAWPSPIRPAADFPCFNPGLTGAYVPNDEIAKAILWPVQWVEPVRRESQRYVGIGPEAIAISNDRRWLYTGLCDAKREEYGTGNECGTDDDAQGWVIRLDLVTHRVERYVQTGGRPLGLAFDKAGRLYIADGTRGLLRVDPAPADAPAPLSVDSGEKPAEELEQSATAATLSRAIELPPVKEASYTASGGGSVAIPRYARLVATCELPGDLRPPARVVEPLEPESTRWRERKKHRLVHETQAKYTDSVAIRTLKGPTGAESEEVWFTCPSQRWPLSEITLDALESVPTGRVFRYVPCDKADPTTCDKTLAASGLMFANGIAIDDRADIVWVSEWYGYRITQLDAPAGDRRELWTRSLFVGNLPGYPDNLTFDPTDGTLWAGLVIRRLPIVDRLRPYPQLEKLLARLPGSLTVAPHAFAVAFDRDGKVVHNLQDTTGVFDQVTGAHPYGDMLLLSSNNSRAIACLRKPNRLSLRGDATPGSDLDPCRRRGAPLQ